MRVLLVIGAILVGTQEALCLASKTSEPGQPQYTATSTSKLTITPFPETGLPDGLRKRGSDCDAGWATCFSNFLQPACSGYLGYKSDDVSLFSRCNCYANDLCSFASLTGADTECWALASTSMNCSQWPTKVADPFPSCARECKSRVYKTFSLDKLCPADLTTKGRLTSTDCDCNYLTGCGQFCSGGIYSEWVSYSLWFSLAGCTSSQTLFETRNYTTLGAFATVAQPLPTNLLGYLEQLYPSPAKHAAPTCVANISKNCSTLDNAIRACYNGSTLVNQCFCDGLAGTNCSSICKYGSEPLNFLSWAVDSCNRTQEGSENIGLAPFDSRWAAFDTFKEEAHLNLIPWSWRVQYHPGNETQAIANSSLPSGAAFLSNGTLAAPNFQPNGTITSSADLPTDTTGAKCPTNLAKLGVFAIVNGITFIITIIVGRREVMYKLTFGFCGKPYGNPYWVFSAVLFSGLTIAGNFINALIIHNTKGFTDSIPTVQLMLLWSTRPRITWIGALLILWGKKKGTYFSTAASAVLTEFILQSVGAYYLGRTVHFAVTRRYLIPHNIPSYIPGARPAYMMYAGSLLWVTAIGIAFAQAVWTFLGLGRIVKKLFNWICHKSQHGVQEARQEATQRVRVGFGRRYANAWVIHVQNWAREHPLEVTAGRSRRAITAQPSQHGQMEMSVFQAQAPKNQISTSQAPLTPYHVAVLERMGLGEDTPKHITMVVMWMVLPFIGQWLFWVGFIHLAGEL